MKWKVALENDWKSDPNISKRSLLAEFNLLLFLFNETWTIVLFLPFLVDYFR